MIGANLKIKYGATLGVAPTVFLAPVWMASLRRHRGPSLVLAAAGIALMAGLLLARFSAADHVVNQTQLLGAALLLVTCFGSAGVLLWVSNLLGAETVLLLFCFGLTASRLLDHASWAAHAWKYGFALPVTIAALAISRKRSVGTSIFVLAAAGAISVVSDYRSFFSFCIVSILLLLWQVASPLRRQRGRRLAPLMIIAAIGYGGYELLTTLFLGGYFGQQIQERSIEQVQASGSLLVGGRPEWTATFRLMALRPQGYGLGVVPNAADVGAGDGGLASININPDYGYNDYMFGGQFRLHSIAADLWSQCGIFGLVLAAVLLIAVVYRLMTKIAERSADALFILISIIFIWDTFFSPIYTASRDVTLVLFILFAGRHVRRTGGTRPDSAHPDPATSSTGEH